MTNEIGSLADLDIKPAKQSGWMNPLNRILIQKAVKAKKTSVTIRDGRVFSIRYHRPGYVWIQINANVGNLSDLVPCGWFPIETILDPEWVASE